MGKLKGHSLQNSGDSKAFIIIIPTNRKPKINDKAHNIIEHILKILNFDHL